MLRIIHLVIGIILVTAALDKALHVEDFRRLLSFQVPVIERWSMTAIVGVLLLIGIESILGTMLLLDVGARLAAAGSMMLLAIFTVGIVVMLQIRDGDVRCGCGGVLTVLGEWAERAPVVIARNVVLIAALGAGFIGRWCATSAGVGSK